MSTDTSVRGWNTRYSEESDLWLGKSPRRMLINAAELLPKGGLALDAAAGVGINSIFMVEHGLRVVAMDFSEVALRLAVAHARERSLFLQAAVCDLALLKLPRQTFDVIGNFFFLERETLPVYHHALKSGGLLFFETLLKTDASISYPEHYLERGELRSAFADFDVLHWEEAVDCGDNRFTEQMIARKPLQEHLG